MTYNNESEIESVYDDFILGLRGNVEKLNGVLQDDFTLTFTGAEGAACTKENFCQNCPIPDYVEFNSSGIIVTQDSATLDVSFKINGKSNSWWISKLNFINDSYFSVPAWKVLGWEICLVDFKPAAVPDKGWADAGGSIEFDSINGVYRWTCSW